MNKLTIIVPLLVLRREQAAMAAAAAPSPSCQQARPLSDDVYRPLDLAKMRRGWETAQEHDYWIPEADIEGQIPADLQGTLFRNGPGLLEIYGKRLAHRESETLGGARR